MHAAIYLRQSLDRFGNMLAIGRQRGPCVDKCEERGWTYTEYVDNDRSASSGKRPEYLRMLTDIQEGKVEAVVVWDLDRLHRRPAELEEFIDLADKRGLMLVTITGDVDLSTHNGRMYARIKGAVARGEMDQKSMRQKAAHRQRAESGKPWGPRRIFGYTEDMQPHPVEAPVVREGFEQFLSGQSFGSIAAAWNDAGLTTTAGNKWRGPSVSKFVTNPKLAGLLAYNGEIVRAGDWPALVDEETWRAVCAIRSDPERRRPGAGGRKYLLTGLALCGKCGTALGSGQTAWKSTMYICRECHGIGRNQKMLDDHIIDAVVARLSRPDARELLVDRDREGVGELSAKAAVLRGKLEALEAEFAEDDDMTTSVYTKMVKRLTTQLGEVEARMADSQKARIFEGIIGADDVGEAFAAAGLDRQREMVAALMRVTVRPTRKGADFRPDDIHIDWFN
ncbi:recombinase family protein [Nocardia nova]|uniref:recombinase family protein n=1 Tax=Nocardia nova TaxID=37330 RepID=UPI0018946AE4|nr:recombinase family protein [Nocardia nova]MBF6276993.1 recombinase family protein [Nocardia nova]